MWVAILLPVKASGRVMYTARMPASNPGFSTLRSSALMVFTSAGFNSGYPSESSPVIRSLVCGFAFS